MTGSWMLWLLLSSLSSGNAGARDGRIQAQTALTSRHADLLTMIAQKERRVNELRRGTSIHSIPGMQALLGLPPALH
jgi:hypothetical protein